VVGWLALSSPVTNGPMAFVAGVSTAPQCSKASPRRFRWGPARRYPEYLVAHQEFSRARRCRAWSRTCVRCRTRNEQNDESVWQDRPALLLVSQVFFGVARADALATPKPRHAAAIAQAARDRITAVLCVPARQPGRIVPDHPFSSIAAANSRARDLDGPRREIIRNSSEIVTSMPIPGWSSVNGARPQGVPGCCLTSCRSSPSTTSCAGWAGSHCRARRSGAHPRTTRPVPLWHSCGPR